MEALSLGVFLGRFRLSLLLLFALMPAVASATTPTLIPMPTSVQSRDGEYRITDRTVVEGDGAAAPTAAYLSKALELKGYKGLGRAFACDLSATRSVPGPEAYRLSATRQGNPH